MKEFKLADKKEGINFPPLHAFDRCTTIPKVDMENIKTRIARDSNGKNIEVPVDMDYKKWYNEYIKDNPDGQLLLKKYQNRSYDRKQFEEYKNIINDKSFPKNFTDYQNLKYGNPKEFDLIKYDYILRKKLINNTDLTINNFDKLYVDERKYTEYLFSGSNLDGLNKGKIFDSVLGYNINNYGKLDKNIKDKIYLYPSRYKEKSKFGEKYEVNMVLDGLLNRKAKVTIGIIYYNNQDFPALTTAYINEIKGSELKNEI